MRRGHEGPDVLHLHTGPALENKRGPRARVLVPRDVGFRSRVVFGGTGEDFGRGGGGEQFGRQGSECEIRTVAHVQFVRATVPRRRVLRARVGVLEDVRGAAGEGPDSAHGD